MMQVLVDSSIWIDYFRGGGQSGSVDALIDANLLYTNDVILAELIPALRLKRHYRVVNLLKEIALLRLEIDWDELIAIQTQCLQNGLNGIGIPDLIVAQNAKQNQCLVYSLDRHFAYLSDYLGFGLYLRKGIYRFTL